MKKKFKETIKSFWEKQTFYPDYGTTNNRKFFDAQYTKEFIDKNNAKIVLDLGAGNGSLITILKEMTNVKKFFAYDLSQNMLDTIDLKRPGASVEINTINLFDETYDFPKSDVIIFFGVSQYLPEKELEDALKNIATKTPNMIFKTAVSLNERVDINKFSEKLGDDYACFYRTTDEYIKVIEKFFELDNIYRAYPDDIESKFGTKQFIIECKSKIYE